MLAEINHYLSDDEAFKLDTVSVRLVKTRESITSEEPLSSPDAVVKALAKEMSDYDREVIGVINFNAKMQPINVNFVSAGTLNYSVAHPREILKSAILSNASSMMMIHNHPSQDTTPSEEDVMITDRMSQLCGLAGIPLVDHIIVGGDGKEYFSFAEKKAMPVADAHYEKNYMNIHFPQVAEKRNYETVNENKTSYTNGNPVKEETEVKMTAYRIVSVFDVSQTEGKPLPQMGVAELTDNVNEYELFVEALKQSTSVPISFENISGAAKGYYNPVTASIAIKAGMPESQTVKTMIHEIAHSILHNDILDEDAKKDRQTKEVEAESVAYTVCQHFGIDTSDYSFGYIAGWSSSKETEELKQSLETIQKTASGLINDIERIMPQLKKDMQLKENVTESVTENIDEPEIEYTAGMRI